jgi:hypothetical protein
MFSEPKNELFPRAARVSVARIRKRGDSIARYPARRGWGTADRSIAASRAAPWS